MKTYLYDTSSSRNTLRLSHFSHHHNIFIIRLVGGGFSSLLQPSQSQNIRDGQVRMCSSFVIGFSLIVVIDEDNYRD